MYREELKGLYVLLSRTQPGPGRAAKEELEESSRNHVQAFWVVHTVSTYVPCMYGVRNIICSYYRVEARCFIIALLKNPPILHCHFAEQWVIFVENLAILRSYLTEILRAD